METKHDRTLTGFPNRLGTVTQGSAARRPSGATLGWYDRTLTGLAKLLGLLPLLVLLSGCAYMHSTTVRTTDPKTGQVKETTSCRAYALLDANSSMLKFRNQSGYVDATNRYAPGTYMAGLNESATTTNLAAILGAMAEGVVKGLK